MTCPQEVPSQPPTYNNHSFPQGFQVRYRYPVLFTRLLFNSENPTSL